jgi:hypothetical protein
VSVWADISAVGDGDNDLVQAATANQPAYDATGGPAGDGMITFDGSNDQLKCPSGMATWNQPAHYFLLVKQISFVSTDVWVAEENSQHNAIRNNGTTDQVAQTANGSGHYSNHVVMTSGTFFLLDSFFSGASSHQRLNNGSVVEGTGVASGNPGSGSDNDFMVLGGENDTSNAANIDVCEFVFFTAEVTGGDLTTLMAYFSDRYGLF